MNNTMKYKGYIGSVEFSENDCIFFGKVQGISSLISYEGSNANELVADFHEAVDEYIALCQAENEAPERSYGGTVNVFLNADLESRISDYAVNRHISVDSFIVGAINEKLASV